MHVFPCRAAARRSSSVTSSASSLATPPWTAGMAAAFAGVSGGYSANILIGTIDPLLAGITQ